jgi:hypothetical protein
MVANGMEVQLLLPSVPATACPGVTFPFTGLYYSIYADVGVDWIDLAQDRNRWRALVYTVMNLRVP